MVGVKWDNGNYGYYRWTLSNIFNTRLVSSHTGWGPGTSTSWGQRYLDHLQLHHPPPALSPSMSPSTSLRRRKKRVHLRHLPPAPPPRHRHSARCVVFFWLRTVSGMICLQPACLKFWKKKLLAPLCAWIARASFGEERHQGGSSQRPHRHHRWHKDKDTTFNTFFDRDKISNSYCKPF